MPTEGGRLPVRLAPAPGEALDGFLERLADLNGLARPELVRLCAGEETAAFSASARPFREVRLVKNHSAPSS